MHIAMIAGEYPPRWGGIGSVVYHLAGHLASFGHQVTVITRADDIKAPAQSGVNIVEVPWLKLPMKSPVHMLKMRSKLSKDYTLKTHLM